MDLKNRVQKLRQQGKTYGEIQTILGKRIPKSTLSHWCRHTPLPPFYQSKISHLNTKNLNKGRLIAVEINKIKRQELLNQITDTNKPISTQITDPNIAKIALSMLCLGEASKYNPKVRGSFYLGNSNPKIILIFLKLLEIAFPDFDSRKLRCTVQCRADQDTESLTKYWHKVTNIPLKQFYKPLIDPRTQGKPTQKPDYKGVLRVDYFNSKTRLELETLANLVYNNLKSPGP